MGTWGIRRIRPGDGPRLRTLRLAALRDSPTAFVETAEQAAALTEPEWEARVRRSCTPGRQVLAAPPISRVNSSP